MLNLAGDPRTDWAPFERLGGLEASSFDSHMDGTLSVKLLLGVGRDGGGFFFPVETTQMRERKGRREGGREKGREGKGIIMEGSVKPSDYPFVHLRAISCRVLIKIGIYFTNSRDF